MTQAQEKLSETPEQTIARLRKELADEKAKRPRLGLVWEDRPESVQQELITKLPVFVRQPDLDITPPPGDVNPPHLLIEGDNLAALTALQATHAGRVDVIYIDPPYNTGEDFIYNDKLISEEDTWRHSTWLSFMNRRLRLAQTLLAPDGVILISIDSNEHAVLKLLCDTIFGEKSYLGAVTWINKTQPVNSGRAKFQLQQNSEYVLVYTKMTRGTYPGFVLEQSIERTYPDQGKHGACRFVGLESTDSGRKKRRTMKFAILGQEPRVGKRWQIGEKLALELEAAGKVEIIDGQVKRAIYPEDDTDGFKPFWSHLDKDVTGTAQKGKGLLTRLIGEGHGFDTVKPIGLMEELLKRFKKDAVVLDFFAGSGTTGHAVASLNTKDGGSRQVILITNNENNICREITIPRLRASLSGSWNKGEGEKLSGGFLVYTMGFTDRIPNADRQLLEFNGHAVNYIALAENAFEIVHQDDDLTVLSNSNKIVAAVPECTDDYEEIFGHLRNLKSQAPEKIVYVFTWDPHQSVEDAVPFFPGWEVKPLPAALVTAITTKESPLA